MVFDEEDPKYRVSCCCKAHVRVASLGFVYITLLLSVVVLIQAAVRLTISYAGDQKIVAVMFLIVSLLTIGSGVVWLLSVRWGRWPFMMFLHSALATWAIICLGGAVLFAFALAKESEAFMHKAIHLTLGTVEYWSTWTPMSTCWMLLVSFLLLTAFFVWALFVLLSFYGYLIVKENAKQFPSWKIGRTSISLHPVAELPEEYVKDTPFVFSQIPAF